MRSAPTLPTLPRSHEEFARAAWAMFLRGYTHDYQPVEGSEFSDLREDAAAAFADTFPDLAFATDAASLPEFDWAAVAFRATRESA